MLFAGSLSLFVSVSACQASLEEEELEDELEDELEGELGEEPDEEAGEGCSPPGATGFHPLGK